jgi:hypothetical protein
MSGNTLLYAVPFSLLKSALITIPRGLSLNRMMNSFGWQKLLSGCKFMRSLFREGALQEFNFCNICFVKYDPETRAPADIE